MEEMPELDPFLSDEGREFLAKWDIRLAGLFDGEIPPAGKSEHKFVECFRQKQDPVGISEKLWFNMQAILELIERCAKLEWENDREKSVRRGLATRLKDIEESEMKSLKAEVERLSRVLRGCQQKLTEYERELNIEVPSAESREGDTCPVCKGTGGMGNCSRCDGKGYL